MEKDLLLNEIKVTVPKILLSDDQTDDAESSPVFVRDKAPSRRVSFASSNFIKKFSIDPEKNTIWDSTYEETVNSDSIHSSENIHGTLNVPQCGLKAECSTTSINLNLEDMDCDLSILNNEIVCKENTGILSKNRKSVLAPTTQKSLFEMRKEDRTILNEVNMEITEQMILVNEAKCEHLNNKTYSSETSMECTLFVIKENQHRTTSLNKTSLNNSNLEYTCQSIKSNYSPTADLSKTSDDVNSMELTQGVGINNAIFVENDATILKHVNMELANKSLLHKPREQFVDLNNSKSETRVFGDTVATVMDMDLTIAVKEKPLTLSERKTTVLTQADTEDNLTMDKCLLEKPQEQLLFLNNIKSGNRLFGNSVADIMDMDLTTSVNVKPRTLTKSNVTVLSQVHREHNLLEDKGLLDTSQKQQLLSSNTSKSGNRLFRSTATSIADTNLTVPINLKPSSLTESNALVTTQANTEHNLLMNKSQEQGLNKSKIVIPGDTVAGIMDWDLSVPVNNVRNANNEHNLVVDNRSIPVSNQSHCHINVENEIDEERISKLLLRNQNTFTIPKKEIETRICGNTVADIMDLGLVTPLKVYPLNLAECLESGNANNEHNFKLDNHNHQIILNTEKTQPEINAENKIDDNENKGKGLLCNPTKLPISKKEYKLKGAMKSINAKAEFESNNQQNVPHSEFPKSVDELHILPSVIGGENNSCVKHKDTEQSKVLPILKNSFSNYTSLSFCTDDTQHLINYDLGNQQSKSDFSKIIAGDLNPIVNSKIMAFTSFGSDVFPVSLENTREIKDCKSLERSNKRDLLGESPPAKTKNLEMSESSSCQKEKLEKFYISQENLTLSDSVTSNDSLSTLTDNIMTKFIHMPETKEKLFRNKELWRQYLNNNQLLERSCGEFRVKMENLMISAKHAVKAYEEQCTKEVQVISASVKKWDVNKIESNSDFNNSSSFDVSSSNMQDSLPFQTNTDFTLSSEKTITIAEKIKEKFESSKTISVENNSCKISTLFDTIQIDVQFMEDSGIVDKMDIRSRISGHSPSIALLVHKIFLERFKERNIQAAVGEKYDVLSLLDYVHLNMEKALDILEEHKCFKKTYNCEMDKSFRAKFYIVNLEVTLYIFVDMSDLDNISEKSVTFTAEFRTINEKEIKKLLNNSSKGLTYLKKILKDIKAYANNSMNKKQT